MKQGLVASLSINGKLHKTVTGVDPRAVLEFILPLVAEGARNGVRSSVSPALEGQPPTADGSYFENYLDLANGGSGWLIVAPCEVLA